MLLYYYKVLLALLELDHLCTVHCALVQYPCYNTYSLPLL